METFIRFRDAAGAAVTHSLNAKIKSPALWQIVSAAVFLALQNLAIAQDFYGLGVIPGGGQNDALLISADGRVVAGVSDGRLGKLAVLWNAAGVITEIDSLPGYNQSDPKAL